MLKNLEATNGLIYAESVSLALSKFIGKNEAHEFVENSCRKAVQQGIHLKEYLRNQPIIQQYLALEVFENLFKL
jgi:3-carboxy-cis,cis-muconate cycloisomerase